MHQIVLNDADNICQGDKAKLHEILPTSVSSFVRVEFRSVLETRFAAGLMWFYMVWICLGAKSHFNPQELSPAQSLQLLFCGCPRPDPPSLHVEEHGSPHA